MVAFVILHYKNFNDTLDCISSIKKLSGVKKIVVVDNHTLQFDEKKQLEDTCDKLLCLKKNEGFARANNIGSRFAIENYHPDFLVVINNDTVIKQKDFLKIIQKKYLKYHFDILGPRIICEEGSGSVNPYLPLKNIEEVQKELQVQKRLLKFYRHTFLYLGLVLYMKLKHLFVKKHVFKNGEEEMLGVALHGCALIFSKQYYHKFQNVFCEKTFLYHEESFLYLRLQQHHLISLYSPDLEIVHKEGASLNILYHNQRKRNLFRTQEIIKSLKILEDVMKKGEEV